MPILQLFGLLIIVGILLYVVTTYIPMDASIKKIIVVLAVVLVVLFLCNLFGLFDSLSGITVGGHSTSGPVHK